VSAEAFAGLVGSVVSEMEAGRDSGFNRVYSLDRESEQIGARIRSEAEKASLLEKAATPERSDRDLGPAPEPAAAPLSTPAPSAWGTDRFADESRPDPWSAPVLAATGSLAPAEPPPTGTREFSLRFGSDEDEDWTDAPPPPPPAAAPPARRRSRFDDDDEDVPDSWLR
jgi:hypothetical protein